MHKLRELWEFHKPVVLLVSCLVFIVAAVAAFYVTSHHSYSHRHVVYAPSTAVHTPRMYYNTSGPVQVGGPTDDGEQLQVWQVPDGAVVGITGYNQNGQFSLWIGRQHGPGNSVTTGGWWWSGRVSVMVTWHPNGGSKTSSYTYSAYVPASYPLTVFSVETGI